MFLSVLIFLPIAFALILSLLKNKKWIPLLSLVFATFEFAFSLLLFFKFNPHFSDLQLVERYSWIPSIGVSYFIALDGLSFWLVLLTTFLIFVTVFSCQKKMNQKGFYASLFILESAVLGTFLSIDVVLFYIFFEFSLIPMYFIIGLWGGARRIYASMKFFIFTMSGSILMLISLVMLILMTKSSSTGGGQVSASLLDLYQLNMVFVEGSFFNASNLLFFAFTLAFAVKVPLFPLHTWLPDAHVEAPTPGSVILAGILLKIGTYGFLRFILPLFPQAVDHWAWLFLMLSCIGIIYGALVAMAQKDIKKLVAYSSVSHMGYVMLGVFALNLTGFSGGVFQMLSHGISTGALFFLVGMIYERTKTREISNYGGLAQQAPIFSIFFIIVSFSSMAVPLTNGFIGEFLILLGLFNSSHQIYTFVAILGVILGASYMLWMIHRVFFGSQSQFLTDLKNKLSLAKVKGFDLNWQERLTMLAMVVLIFWMGILPNHFLKWTEASLDHLQKNRYNYTLKIMDSKTQK